MRSWRWWVGIGPFPIVLSAFFIAWAGCNATGHLMLRAELDRVARTGLPLRSADTAPPEIQDSQNAAIGYREAVHSLELPDGEWRFAIDTFAYHWSDEVSPDDIAEITRWHDRNADVVTAVVAAGRLPECRANIDYGLGVNDASLSLVRLGNTQSLLAVSVRLAHQRGESATAGDRLNAYWRLHRLPAGVPWLYCHVYASMWQVRTLELLGCLLAAGAQNPPADFAEALRGIDERRFRRNYLAVIPAERAQWFEMLMGERLHRLTARDDASKEGLSRVVWNVTPFIHGRLNWSLAWYSKAADEALAACNEDPVKRAWENFPRGTELLARAYLRGEFPVLEGQQLRMSIRLGIEADQCTEILRTGLAALEHRHRTGAWPDSPQGRDYFSGKELRARLDDDVLVLYSVGRDGTDDDADDKKDLVLRLPGRRR